MKNRKKQRRHLNHNPGSLRKLLVLLTLVCILAQTVSAQVALMVNASKTKRPFYGVGLGSNVGIWTYSSYHPASERDPRLVSVAREAGIRIIRFPAGNEADDAWFDRSNSTPWYEGTGTYTRTLRADFLNSVHDFADEIGAELLLVVNAKTDDPQMAADLVRYCNIDTSFNVRYFQIGNEPTLYRDDYEISPEDFAQRVGRYSEAMKAVDSSIVITAGGAHQPPLIESWLEPYLRASGTTTNAVTFHYYPLWSGQTDINHGMYPSIENLLSFEYETNTSLWHQNGCIRVVNRFLEEWSHGVNHLRDQYSPGAPIGITELSPTAGGGALPDSTFAHAIWAADVIGRITYYGADFLTQFLLQGNQSYAMIDNDFNIRPVWYTYVMYNRYFGDTMVESVSGDESRMTVWASKKESQPDKLYVMVINRDSNDIAATVNIEGFSADNAVARVLGAPSVSSPTGVNIDGVEADESRVLAGIPGSAVAISGNTIDFTFEGHSVTSLEITGFSGDSTDAAIEHGSPIPGPAFSVLNQNSIPAVRFIADNGGVVSIEAVNAFGQKVLTYENNVSSGGMVTVPLMNNGRVLPNGAYIIRYKTPELEEIHRFFMTR